jgi:hypothetical protein
MIMAAAKAIARHPPIRRLIRQRDELLNEVLKAKPATDFLAKLSAINGVAAVKITANRPVLLTNMGSPTADPAHALYPRFLEELRQRSVGHILEVGARARSGITRREAIPAGWRYTGLDVVNGPNVDVVGDAHQLSRLFPEQHFDAIMTFSTLEHLMMPWKFAIELNKALTHGAIGLFFTHHTWPLHEVPWDFWRFSDEAWKAILNRATGFEIIAAALGEPAHVVPQQLHAATNFGDAHVGYMAASVLFRKIGNTVLEWPVEIADITTTTYPAELVADQQAVPPAPAPAPGRP